MGMEGHDEEVMKYVGPILAIVMALMLFDDFLNNVARNRGDLFIDLDLQRCLESHEDHDSCYTEYNYWKKKNKSMRWNQ